MQKLPIKITRHPLKYIPDNRRVITRIFLPGDSNRIRLTVDQIMQLSDQEVCSLLQQSKELFATRHRDIESIWRENCQKVVDQLDCEIHPSEPRQLLIGSYFTMEYSVEAAALFNPSIVPHYDQSGTPPGSLRFLMSLRATGEGHVSSIVFRTGIIDADGRIKVDPPSKFVSSLKLQKDTPYDKQTFFYKLIEIGGYSAQADLVLDELPEEFTLARLQEVVDEVKRSHTNPASFENTAETIMRLARTNYVLRLPLNTPTSEVVIFPASETESHGIEDARFVRFRDDDGKVFYYGTYIAYDGAHITPQILETTDFDYVNVETMHGRYALNKGHALFPRKINGWYLMCSRIDGRNLFIQRSKNIRFWNDAQILDVPLSPWEFIQIGNCGSPLETEKGWLLLTHGVGPMRRYCIGASLLDLEEPTRLIGHLKEPLLMPTSDERDGYVPNVVYSCGALIHRDHLVISYAMADAATSFATLSLSELLDHLKGKRGHSTFLKK